MPGQPPWTCDACGHPITSIKDGWIEWLTNGNPETSNWHIGSCRDLRLVHHRAASPHADRHNACYHNEAHWFALDRSTVSDLHLSRFVGADGLMILLGFLSDKKFVEPEEVLEMIKRIHIPGYEQARRSFNSAIADGAFEPNTAPGYYMQRDIEATLAWIHAQQGDH